MDLDDKICLCFGVSKRKVINFIRIEKPRVAGQLSECYGAGTGCGWCRTYLMQMFEEHRADQVVEGESSKPNEPGSTEEYAKMRKKYMLETGRRPPTVPGD